ncbi:MAG: bifunctional (p)ppGpp synthetase/guanosine-3',5'-bis(diphosphate) 3'-pyrophosphohydrolase [Bacilli bacterium]|nr:bifunctional (p)ppGpp synthetase/guanosine-3',5'-bis(diphosphate) 3'-pyrophosphohydrolase [Bacilli bacterium]
MNQIETYEELRDKLKEYLSEDELDVVGKAYMFAFEKHFGKKRLTGDNYIIHPLNVAYILSDIKADYQTICAALMHDVLEEDKTIIDQLSNKFGDEIARLVEGVTKINKLSFSGDSESIKANHRKILVGLSEDVRVIIIKLADRLHNMRTLWALPLDRQRAKAKETLEVLTPIAHRLGMSSIKSELEDLSLRYYKPDAYFSIVEKLNQTKVEREDLVDEMIEQVSIILNENGIKHTIKGRAKAIYSIYNKLNKGKKFSDIYDLLALRVYVQNESECYQVLGLIHSKYKPLPKRFKDYIAMPKPNMYQSLHTTVFGPGGNLFEIQIRTYEMDVIAENGIASHWSYKENGRVNLQSAMEQKLQFFKSLMDLKDANEEDVSKGNEEVFKDSIYVFTPKGDVVEMPLGSTPIDFAYKVHTEVGDKMIGAIVNDNIVPLDYKLKDNDIVKINTNKNSTPSKEWINIAKTAQAKSRIKAFFSKIDKKDYIKLGQENLNKELRKRKESITDFLTNENIIRIIEEFKYDSLEDIYYNIGSNKVPINSIINFILNDNITKEELILKKTQNKDIVLPNTKNDIIVSGVDEIKVNIASCCKPVPGDKLVGYITKGNGISAHRVTCPNMMNNDERTIDISWNDCVTKKYPTNILVHTLENKNVLLDIIAKSSNTEVTIQSTNFVNTNDNFLYEVVVLVKDTTELTKFINEIKTIPNVIDVERSMK